MPLPASRARSPSENGYRLCRLWLPGDNTRRLAATLLSVAWLAAAPFNVAAQDDAPNGAQPDNPLGDLLAPRPQTRLPTPDESMDTFQAVEAAVREWSAPDKIPCPATAARVALYQHGNLVGAGVSQADHPGEPGIASAATGEAMTKAARVLLPRADALADEQLRTLAAELTVSLEMAGPFTPLSETELANPDAVIRPGIDGLAARVGGEWLLVFPSEILASGTPAGVRLPAMAARLLGDPTLGVELPLDLATGHSVGFYRFEVMRVANVGRGGAATFLRRGGSFVGAGATTSRTVVRFAEDMLGHLEATRIEGESRLGLLGTFDAPRGVAEAVASPMQQSLAALALLRLAQTERFEAETRERARTLAREIMADLAVVEPIEIEPAEDGVAAAIAWVVLDGLGAAGDAELGPLFETCESMLAEHAASERGDMTASVTNAILVWALAERAHSTGKDADIAERDMRALYAATEPGGLVGLMPWLGWAELRLAGDAPVPAQAALRQVRDQVWEHQLTVQDTGPSEGDLAGGVIFTRGLAALPTWATARPIALCATMLGDPRLTTQAEASGEIVRLVQAIRFLRQLSAREADCAFYPRPELAMGGIRAALWDHTMPPEATAMTLLAMTEFVRSIGILEDRQKQAETPDSR